LRILNSGYGVISSVNAVCTWQKPPIQ